LLAKRKQSNDTSFTRRLTSVSALPCKTRTHENYIFSSFLSNSVTLLLVIDSFGDVVLRALDSRGRKFELLPFLFYVATSEITGDSYIPAYSPYYNLLCFIHTHVFLSLASGGSMRGDGDDRSTQRARKIYLNVSEKNPATESLFFAIWYSRKRF